MMIHLIFQAPDRIAILFAKVTSVQAPIVVTKRAKPGTIGIAFRRGPEAGEIIYRVKHAILITVSSRNSRKATRIIAIPIFFPSMSTF